MRNKKTTENGTQIRIYRYIQEYPGLHLRELSRKLEIPTSTLNYHLRCLSKHGLIFTEFEQRFARFYATKEVGTIQKNLINALRQETTRNIIVYISLNLNASRTELSKELDSSPASISKYLKRLVKLGIIEPAPVEDGMICTSHENRVIIERSPKGREIIYRLTRPSKTNRHIGKLLDELLKNYKTGLDYDTIKAVLEYIDTMHPDRKLPKKVKHKKNIVDQFMHNIYETFPHPYHI